MIEINFVYNPIFKLNVKHNYYVEQPAKDFVLKPLENSLKLVNRLGLILKEADSEYLLLADPNKLDSLLLELRKNNPFRITYLVYSANPYFLNFTETPSEINNSMFYFSNNNTIFSEGSVNLHKSEFVTIDDKYPVHADYKISADGKDKKIEVKDEDGSIVLTKNINGEQSLILTNSILPVGLYHLYENDKLVKSFILFTNMPVRKPIGIVSISLSGSLKEAIIDKFENFTFPSFSYQISFNARTTYWKYYLIGKYNSNLKNTIIESGDDTVKFKGPEETALKKGVNAITFLSEKPLPLKQMYEHRFQLKTNGSNFAGAKTIMERLPLASPEIIKPFDADSTKFISEIIVYI